MYTQWHFARAGSYWLKLHFYKKWCHHLGLTNHLRFIYAVMNCTQKAQLHVKDNKKGIFVLFEYNVFE